MNMEDLEEFNAVYAKKPQVSPITIYLQVLLLVGSMIQILTYLRIHKKLGQQVQLVADCIVPLFTYLIFYFFILTFYSLIYQVLGYELALDNFGESDYESLDKNFAYYIMAFRNSIGDLSTPSYNYWAAMKNKDNDKYSAQFMIYTIWTFWLVNIITFTVLLLNFLIAVIS